MANFFENVLISSGSVTKPTIVSVVKNAVKATIPPPLSLKEPISGNATKAGIKVIVPITAEKNIVIGFELLPKTFSMDSIGMMVIIKPINNKMPTISESILPIIPFAFFIDFIVFALSFISEITKVKTVIPNKIIVLIILPFLFFLLYNGNNKKRVTNVTLGGNMNLGPLFKGIVLSKDDYILRKYHKNQIIHQYGEACNYLSIVESGEAIIQHINEEGQLLTLLTIRAGMTIGGNRIFSSAPTYPMTITARTDITLVLVSQKVILKLCEDPEFLVRFLKDLSDKSMMLVDHIKKSKFMTIEKIISQYLSTYILKGVYEIILPFSKKEWAEMIGVERTSLSRALQKMVQKNWISVNRNHITIIQPNQILPN